MAALIEQVGIVIPLVLVAALYTAAAVCAVRELLYGRSSQGSIGWLLSLFFFPYVTVFLYLAFGWKRFDDYVRLRRRVGPNEAGGQPYDAQSDSALRVIHRAEEASDAWPLLVNLSPLPFLGGNDIEVLVDGRATYESIFAGIRAAKTYVLAQFYIIRNDEIGNRLADLLIEKAEAGVTVLLLYDDIGSAGLSRRFLERLEKAGVMVSGFNRSRPMFPFLRPFRINFRNHRKIVIADGRHAWIGGLNMGNEYLGLSQKFNRWRDTHVRVDGPAALAAQISFAEDWHWATGGKLPIDWPHPQPLNDGQPVLVMPSGPADTIDTCAIAFTEAIGHARRRLWIVSPYFVPGEDIQTALSAAVLRGVDVRLLLPKNPDGPIVGLANECFAETMAAQGVRTYYYREGFLHQKVMLVDDALASIGTVNFDNRSFHINFEVTLWLTEPDTIGFVRDMLELDFAHSDEKRLADYRARPPWRGVASRLARLFAPLL
ncbi:cardiolipin synthase [Breoghania sp.]|uniref:cardiolipin synthase n=1 Tax=Breoghania sp. TaxID=2065378 RepID=UPI002AA8AA6A|nr:cardiolipin synthase [Breoghania sp.]